MWKTFNGEIYSRLFAENARVWTSIDYTTCIMNNLTWNILFGIYTEHVFSRCALYPEVFGLETLTRLVIFYDQFREILIANIENARHHSMILSFNHDLDYSA